MSAVQDNYDFPTQNEGENFLRYIPRIYSYHNQFLGKPGLPGAIAWLIYAGTFFVIYIICVLLATVMFMTFILFIFGFILYLIAFVFFVLAIISIIICLVYFLVWLATGANRPNSEKQQQQNV